MSEGRSRFPRGACLAALVLSLVMVSPAGERPAVAGEPTAARPVRLSIEAARRQITAGSAWTCRVSLKGLLGQSVPAAATTDVVVDVGSGARRKLTIAHGATAAEATWTFPVAGFHVVRAEADGLVDAALPLVVVAEPADPSRTTKRFGTPSPTPIVAPDKPLPGGALIQSLQRLRAKDARETSNATAREPAPRPSVETPPPPSPLPEPQAVGEPDRAASRSGAKPLKGAKRMPDKSARGDDGKTSAASAKPDPSGRYGMGAPATSASAAGAERPSRGLALYVVPERVQPLDDGWTAEIAIVAEGGDSVPTPVTEAIDVRLAAGLGRLTPAAVTIARGATLPESRVLIHSDRPGTDQVSAISSLGVFRSPAIEYAIAPAARLRVDANPPRTINSGRSPIRVTVLLLDAQNRPTANAAGDVEVVLTSTLGAVSPSTLTIKKNEFAAEAELTSSVSGAAIVTARASGMSDATAAAGFDFPTRLVLLAAAGGLVGATVRSRRQLARGRIGRALIVNLALGGALGLVFFVLAMFGAVGALPKLAMPIDKIPSVNELGALVLGVVGGWLGRRFLPNLSGGGDADAPKGGEKRTRGGTPTALSSSLSGAEPGVGHVVS